MIGFKKGCERDEKLELNWLSYEMLLPVKDS